MHKRETLIALGIKAKTILNIHRQDLLKSGR